MELKLTFLGTGCSAPTRDRNLTGIVLHFNGKNYLFDCPENTQQQMLKAKVSYMKIDSIFFSHFHADHFLGLPGLLATMNMFERDSPLKIFGPRGIHQMVQKALAIALIKPEYEIKIHELKKGIVLKENNFSINAFPLKHNMQCYGFCFKEKDKKGKFIRKKAEALGIPPGPLYSMLQQGKKIKWKGKTIKPRQVMDYSKGRKGRKVCIVLDTLPVKNYTKYLKEADVLVHESVFASAMEKRAKETFHCTSEQAAEIAKKAKVKKLVLTHFSMRYRNVNELEKEAKKVFAKTVASRELMELSIPR